MLGAPPDTASTTRAPITIFPGVACRPAQNAIVATAGRINVTANWTIACAPDDGPADSASPTTASSRGMLMALRSTVSIRLARTRIQNPTYRRGESLLTDRLFPRYYSNETSVMHC